MYQKLAHTSAAYTILMFQVDDIQAAAGELTERGVRFERYEEMDKDERDVTRNGPPYPAWFKDPARNLLEVLQVP